MKKLFEKLTNIQSFLLSLGIALLGVILIIISELFGGFFFEPVKLILRDLGSVIIASVSVAFFWDVFTRRALLRELFSATKLANEIDETGLIGISSKWDGQINWKELFAASNRLQIFFMYGSTWRNTNRENIKKFAKKRNARAIIVLPDYTDIAFISRIAIEVDLSPDALINRIREAENDFIQLFNNSKKLSIWHTSIFPIYSYYCFDSASIITFYSLSREKVDVPAFLVKSTGSLYKFFQQDFSTVISGGDQFAVKIYPT
jgi:hypothetical protein